MSYCTYSSTDVNRDYLGATSMGLRTRIDYTSGGQGIFAAQASQRINSTFFNQASSWARDFDNLTYNWMESGGSHIDWIGHVGIYGHCTTSGWTAHHTGRALDVGRIQLNNGWFVDTNWSWSQGIMHKRRYLATALTLRRHFETVLTAWYNNDHHNHIHTDNWKTLGPIRSSERSDTSLIQAACNYMNGEALHISGTWNTATNAAFGRLLNKMDLTCLKPRSNTDHMKIFCGALANDALNNVPAGSYKWGVCPA